MSQPQNQPQKKKPQPKTSKTDSTPSKASEATTAKALALALEKLEQYDESLAESRRLLASHAERDEEASAFQKASEEAEDDDLRIKWEVTVIRGKSTVFKHLAGTATMSGALAPKVKLEAAAKIEQIMQTSVLAPLVARCQEELEKDVLREEETYPVIEERPTPAEVAGSVMIGGDKVDEVAAELDDAPPEEDEEN